VANYRVSTKYKTNNTINKTKTHKNKRKMIKLKYRLLKISTNLQTEFAARTHLAVGQWMEELNWKIFGCSEQEHTSRLLRG
jgi:hypothetical protein